MIWHTLSPIFFHCYHLGASSLMVPFFPSFLLSCDNLSLSCSFPLNLVLLFLTLCQSHPSPPLTTVPSLSLPALSYCALSLSLSVSISHLSQLSPPSLSISSCSTFGWLGWFLSLSNPRPSFVSCWLVAL